MQNTDYDEIRSVAMIGNYLPRQCGIATFTSDLVEAISAAAPQVECQAVVMNDTPDGYFYPEKVRFEIQQNKLSEYDIAAEFLNINQMDIVCVQHEYGIFGGPAGSHLLKLLGELRMPVVTTLHTVLENPRGEYKDVMLKLADLSERMIVMSHKAIELLRSVYRVEEEKITFIHHGIHPTPFEDPNYYKDQFGVEGRKMLLTFGLLSPNKGLENVLHALPKVIEKHPDVVYIILGATHPHILNAHGDEYRISLQQLVHKLKLNKHVSFQNRFVDLKELREFLGAADIYITPYLEEAQITSGTLIYAMGAGKPVISTPYWYAAEMLSDGRGKLVPFKNPDAIAEAINHLLDHETERHAIRKKAYNYTRKAVWQEVASKYLQVFKEVKHNRAHHPRSIQHTGVYQRNVNTITEFELPEVRFDHLKILTDDTGIYQHAFHTIPDRNHGYCTDDNARALIFAVMARKYLFPDSDLLNAFSNRYLSFLMHAFNAESGRFRNFMNFSRQWLEEAGSEDSHGRALWGLGKTIELSNTESEVAMSVKLFNQALRVVEEFHTPRSIAFTLVGINAYLAKYGGDSEVRRIGSLLTERLSALFSQNASQDWPWLEDTLTYANGKIPHALLLSGRRMEKQEYIDQALNSLEWLVEIQCENGRFVPIGNNGWYARGENKARFDQQPIEAHAMTEACVEAFNHTRDKCWMDRAVMCFNWYLGNNDLNLPLYNPRSGGCRDGLMADGINLNEGAESTLACLLSLITLQNLYAEEVLKQPTLTSAA